MYTPTPLSNDSESQQVTKVLASLLPEGWQKPEVLGLC